MATRIIAEKAEIRESSIEHFARIVSPLHWDKVLIAMLTACFDGAGKDTPKHKVITVAGFASFSGVWGEFTEKWESRLGQDHLPYFHAGDFAHSTGVFVDGWKGNEPRRRSLASDLMTIIAECGLRKFGCILRLEDFQYALRDHAPQQHEGWPLMDAYGLTAMWAVEDFQAFARREGITRNVRYVFEKGDPEDVLRQIFRGFGSTDPDFMWSKPHIDSKGFSHDPFVGLQAAGWAAYEYYLHGDRLMYGTPSKRWAVQQFDTLPGSISVRGRNPLSPDVPSINDYLAGKMEAVRQSVLRLDQLKGSRQSPTEG